MKLWNGRGFWPSIFRELTRCVDGTLGSVIEHPSLSVERTSESQYVVNTRAGREGEGGKEAWALGRLGLAFNVERRGNPIGG